MAGIQSETLTVFRFDPLPLLPWELIGPWSAEFPRVRIASAVVCAELSAVICHFLYLSSVAIEFNIQNLSHTNCTVVQLCVLPHPYPAPCRLPLTHFTAPPLFGPACLFPVTAALTMGGSWAMKRGNMFPSGM
jgi:hypothetical protein